jgi:hypothetical protein
METSIVPSAALSLSRAKDAVDLPSTIRIAALVARKVLGEGGYAQYECELANGRNVLFRLNPAQRYPVIFARSLYSPVFEEDLSLSDLALYLDAVRELPPFRTVPEEFGLHEVVLLQKSPLRDSRGRPLTREYFNCYQNVFMANDMVTLNTASFKPGELELTFAHSIAEAVAPAVSSLMQETRLAHRRGLFERALPRLQAASELLAYLINAARENAANNGYQKYAKKQIIAPLTTLALSVANLRVVTGLARGESALSLLIYEHLLRHAAHFSRVVTNLQARCLSFRSFQNTPI